MDGTTAVALVYSVLQQYTNVSYYIPDRYGEGYGLSYKGIDTALERGASLMIALDCGIKEVEKVVTKIEYINEKTGENELLLKIQQLEEEISTKTTEIGTIRKEFSTKTEEMEIFFQNEMSNKDNELDELRRNLDINSDDNKVKMLQQTVQNLTGQVRDLKKKNEELNKQMLEKPIESDFTRARFHGSSNLNNDLYR